LKAGPLAGSTGEPLEMIQAILIALLVLALFPAIRRFVVRLVGRAAAVAMGAVLIFLVVVALVQGG
jgi:hypothetical protein